LSRGSSRRRAGLAALGLAAGLTASCFDPPAQRVTFACDPNDAPACPPGYACEADGCCHREGTDVEDDFGACALGVEGTGSTDDSESSSESSTESSTGGTESTTG